MFTDGAATGSPNASAASDVPPGSSLWEGVPPAVLWLVQAQVKLLLSNYWPSLEYRPGELLEDDESSDEDEGEGEDGAAAERPRAGRGDRDPRRRGHMEPQEAALAAFALRDKVIGARVQKVLDRLVPSRMSEAAFWDNLFSHIDVIKVRLVTEYLTAEDAASKETAAKHEGWVALYDSMEEEMRTDLRRAAERIAARQQPPQPTASELALGLDAHRPPVWAPNLGEGHGWLEYVEDGPVEVAKVLRAALVARGELDDEPQLDAPLDPSAPAALPLFRSPDEVGRHRLVTGLERPGEALEKILAPPHGAEGAAEEPIVPKAVDFREAAPEAAPVAAPAAAASPTDGAPAASPRSGGRVARLKAAALTRTSSFTRRFRSTPDKAAAAAKPEATDGELAGEGAAAASGGLGSGGEAARDDGAAHQAAPPVALDEGATPLGLAAAPPPAAALVPPSMGAGEEVEIL